MTLLFQGCIEITEKVIVNEDRSGSMSLSAGLGASNTIMALIGQFADFEIDDDMLGDVARAVRILKSCDGISNVRFTDNMRKGNVELSFDFKDDNSLNKALYAVGEVEKNFFQPNIYKVNSSKFVRNNTTRWLLMFMEQEEENLPDESLYDLVQVKSVYQMPNDIKRVKTSGNYKTSADNRTITTTHFLSDLVDEKINTRVKVKY